MAYWRFTPIGGIPKHAEDLPNPLRAALEEIPGTRLTDRGVAVPENGAWLVAETLDALEVPYQLGRPAPRPKADARLAARWLREWVPPFLTPYQREGVMRVLNLPGQSGMYWWSAGSGKTLGAIVWALCTGPAINVVTTKAAVRGTWAREIETYTQGCEWRLLEGRAATVLSGLPTDRPVFLVTGYDTLPQWISILEKLRPRSWIGDEIHILRNPHRWDATIARKEDTDDDGGETPPAPSTEPLPEPEVTFSLKDNRTAAGYRLSRTARRRLGATATPISDRVRDLWSQLDLVHPWEWGNFRKFAMRYCLSPETPILRADGAYAPIADLRIGDSLVGWSSQSGYRRLQVSRLLAQHRTIAPARVEVLLTSGRRVICTPDHRWLYNPKSTSTHPYRALFGELHHGRWRHPIKHLVRIAAPPSEHATTDEYRLGYLRGLVDGDGWSRAEKRSTRVVIAGKDVEHLSFAIQYGRNLGLPPATTRLRKEDGLTEVCFGTGAAHAVIMSPWRDSDEYRRGWLAGMYDAEGTDQIFSQYRRVNPDKHARIAACLRHFQFAITEREEQVAMLGGRLELLRFYDLAQPKLTRKRMHAWGHSDARMCVQEKDPIVAIAPLPAGEVVAITTETGNYIANGFGSKNCSAVENSFGGLDTRGKSNLAELQKRCTYVVHRVPFSVANRDLPPKRRLVTYVKVNEQVRAEGMADEIRRAMKGVRSGAEGRARLREVLLMEAAARKRKIVVAHVVDAVAGGLKVCVFTGRRRDVTDLAEGVRKACAAKEMPGVIAPSTTVPIWWGDGGTPLGEPINPAPSTRYGMLDEYMKSPGPAVLIGTGDAWGEGLNIQDTDLGIFAMLPYTPRQIIQWEGRWVRLGMKRPCLIRYLICEGTIDERVASILLNKLPAVEKATQSDEIAGLGRELIGMSEEELLDSMLDKVLGEEKPNAD